MIKSHKQLKIAQKRLGQLLASAESSNELDRTTWLALAHDVQAEIREYEDLRAGHVRLFNVSSVEDLADALVKARLAPGITQKELADRLRVSEQMVQRDEAGGYEHATLARLGDVIDALGYELVGALRLQQTGTMSAVNGPTNWPTVHQPVTVVRATVQPISIGQGVPTTVTSR
jgi:ribosome-binding protein aMBF1 (putative translation factor)